VSVAKALGNRLHQLRVDLRRTSFVRPSVTPEEKDSTIAKVQRDRIVEERVC
jgi:hypothetical protein